ncbi:pyridoxamine 5'-phosphate oxidase family protein [Streptomyces sp. CRN 30]|uniref:pyridoxamine 5'-phosphate oxidase family protein n=1 Tax=Streptomyces sp. CRN 30 TaxID=3075613 RepID=UPI002A81CB97|nr:pyridoxamine 5'-phosphate oxidase family protein [Streptomyces sp. CRN 30]
MYRADGFRQPDRPGAPAAAAAGRILQTRAALPAVFLVGFVLDGDGAVLLCASVVSVPVRAVGGIGVAFEADEADEVDVAAHFLCVEAELVTGRVLVGGRTLYGVDLYGVDPDARRP